MHISAQTKYTGALTPEEKRPLQTLIQKGSTKARTITRARILLFADEQKTDHTICDAVSIVRSVVYDTRKRDVFGGRVRALDDRPRPGKTRKLTGKQEAEGVAIACSDAPKGSVRWTMNLLTEEVCGKLGVSIGRTAVYRVLLRNDTKPWLKTNVVYPHGDS